MEKYESQYEKVRLHPFFQGVEKEQCLELLNLCKLWKYEKSTIIFHANEQREGLLLLLSGIAEVYVASKETPIHREVLEVVQQGEMIGFSSLADFLGVSKRDQKPEQLVEVRAVENTEALFIPFSVITKRWDDPNLHDYLLTQVSVRLKDIYVSLAEQVKLARNFGVSGEAIVMRVQDIMSSPIISVASNDSIKTVATKMMKHRTSSVLVVDGDELKGIVTERDLVERVIGNERPYTDSANSIMTPGPITINRLDYYYNALSALILHGVKHLPVVEGEMVVGVVSLSDLLRKKNENMMKTIQTIEHAKENTLPQVKQAIYDVLATLINGQVPIFHTLEVITTLYDRLVNRCIHLAIDTLEKQGLYTKSGFCFYQMGSSGRAEQFLLTDQDHFLVFEDGREDGYFTSLTEEIVRLLEVAGYVRCKGNMMASFPIWRGSVTQWQDRLRDWSVQSTNQNLLLAQNFFSYRFVYGSQNLHQLFERKITEQLTRGKIFFYRLTEVEKENHIPTLAHPIRSLFRLDRKQLDMKKEVLFPYHHSLQILSLVNGIVSGTPIDRINKLVDKKVLSVDFAKDIKQAVSELMSIYVKQRWKQYQHKEPTTSVLNFTHLTSREKEDLILSLNTLKELQSLVFSHF